MDLDVSKNAGGKREHKAPDARSTICREGKHDRCDPTLFCSCECHEGENQMWSS